MEARNLQPKSLILQNQEKMEADLSTLKSDRDGV